MVVKGDIVIVVDGTRIPTSPVTLKVMATLEHNDADEEEPLPVTPLPSGLWWQNAVHLCLVSFQKVLV